MVTSLIHTSYLDTKKNMNTKLEPSQTHAVFQFQDV